MSFSCQKVQFHSSIQKSYLSDKDSQKNGVFFSSSLIDAFLRQAYNGGAVTEAAPALHVPPQVI